MTRPILLCSTDKAFVRDLQRTVKAFAASGQELEVQVAPTAAEGLRIASAMTAPLVIVDARLDEATDLLRALQQQAPEATRTAVSASWSDPLRYAMQAAGAAETLDAPLDSDRLRGLLGIGSLLNAPARKGRLLCFIGAQSGNGASTICLHLGRLLADRSERRTLLVELDFHSGALACRMGLEAARTLADLSGMSDAEAMRRWPDALTSWERLDVLLGPGSSNAMSARGLPPVTVVLDAARRAYDDVLADLPCSMNASVRDVVVQADRVYLTATAEVSSLHLASRRFLELRSAGVAESNIYLVLNRVGPAGGLHDEDVRRIVGIGVSHRLRNDYHAAADAEARAEVLPSDSALGRGLEEMAEELRGKKPPASRLVRRGLEWFFRGGS